jgi:hypothetical protein
MAAPEAPPVTEADVHAAVAAGTAAVQQAEAAFAHPSPETITPILNTAVQLEGEAAPLIQETRRGYKTTEFYVLLAAGIQDVIGAVPPKDKLLITILGGVYALARGIAKNGIPNVVTGPPAE